MTVTVFGIVVRIVAGFGTYKSSGSVVLPNVAQLEAQYLHKIKVCQFDADHIKPQSLFNFESPEDVEFKQCWALENLQPMSAKENRKKSNKYRSEI